ncbi:MAG: ATP-dependent endonuclease [Armatimonadetes bacterium]|nr:ATP-dependent endonuclease [Armatimonadota bacterium]
MRIEQVAVNNFRCLQELVVECTPLTVLIGANGAGKSALLAALYAFYNPERRLTEEDWYDRATSTPVRISVTFSDLRPQELDLYKSYVPEEKLTVEYVAGFNEQPKYHASYLQHPTFVEIGQKPANDLKAAYTELRQTPEFEELPHITRVDDARQAMAQWEAAHPDSCERYSDDGSFFGFRNVGKAKLERWTKFVLVRAVREAAQDAVEGKGSALGDLLDVVIKTRLARRPELVEFRTRVREEYGVLFGDDNLRELPELSADLTTTIQAFAPGGAVSLRWDKLEDLDIPDPHAVADLVEDGFRGEMSRKGHGLQRAYLLALLQHLAVARAPSAEQEAGETLEESEAEPLPSLIIGIEEPELYQHPNRARRMAEALLAVVTDPECGVAEQTQVIYTTHSPFLVGLERFDQLRRLSKTQPDPGAAAAADCICPSMNSVMRRLQVFASCSAVQGGVPAFQERLRLIVSASAAEAFFADAVVLVEGPCDEAAIVGSARVLGFDLKAGNISVVAGGGKTTLGRLKAVFESLGIPVYVVFDGDADELDSESEQRRKDANPECTRCILGLCGAEPTDRPGTRVEAAYACFEKNLERTMKEELGAEWRGTVLGEICEEYNYASGYGDKSSIVMEKLVRRAQQEGKQCETLERIVRAIQNMAQPANAARG